MIVVSTDSQENATLLTETLLNKSLVACIQAIHTHSTYKWQGQIVSSQEIRLEIKTKTSQFDKIKNIILELHTYDVPEILMFICDGGNASYFTWIEKETR